MNEQPFLERLRALVEKIGTGKSAEACGVTPRTIQLWMRGKGSPNRAAQVGALAILERIKPKAR